MRYRLAFLGVVAKVEFKDHSKVEKTFAATEEAIEWVQQTPNIVFFDLVLEYVTEPDCGPKEDTMRVHHSITAGRVLDACERELCSLDNPGFCVVCGEDAEGVEPDARAYQCESCGKHGVYGAAELLLMGAYHDKAK